MKTTKVKIKEWNKSIAAEEMSWDLELTISEVINYLEDQSETMDKLKQIIFTYEALLNEIWKEKFIIEDEDLVKHLFQLSLRRISQYTLTNTRSYRF